MTDLSNNQINTDPRGKWLDVWREFSNHKGAVTGAIIFFVIVVLVLLGPFFGPMKQTASTFAAETKGLLFYIRWGPINWVGILWHE